MNPTGNEFPQCLIGTVNECISLSANSACTGRRKSISYQPQTSLKSNGGGGDENTTAMKLSTTGRFSPHPNEILLPQSAKLTIPRFEKYDDTLLNGCVPPPSPAPNSDCLSSGINHSHAHAHVHTHSQSHCQTQSKSTQMQQLNLNHFQHQALSHAPHSHPHSHPYPQVYPLSSSNSASSLCTSNTDNSISSTTLHKHGKYNHAMSPNSKYRLERYRESVHMHQASQQKTKIMDTMTISSPSLASAPTPSNFSSSGRYFLPTAKMVQCDTYGGYLGSTVHTPVKRYVPTPPPSADLYTDLAFTTSAAASNVATPPPLALTTHYVNMPLTYNYRGKCCQESGQDTFSKSAQTYSDINGSSSTSSTCPCPSPSPASSGISVSFAAPVSASNMCSPTIPAGLGSSCKNRSAIRNLDDAESNILVIQSTITQVQNQSQSQGRGQDTGTCLHCNTARRTTGVHQTTQTTGPISPVPMAVSHVPHDLVKLKQHEQEVIMTTSHPTSVSLPPATISIESTQLQQQSSNLLHADSGNPISYQRHMYATPQQTQLHNIHQYQQHQQQQPQHQQQHHQHQQQHQQHMHQQHQQTLQVLPQQQQNIRYSCKKRISIYMRREISRFFGVETTTEGADFNLWYGRHRRMALRCFGPLNSNPCELEFNSPILTDNRDIGSTALASGEQNSYASDRPDILPAQDGQNVGDIFLNGGTYRRRNDFNTGEFVERKASVAHMLMTSVTYLINMFNKRPTMSYGSGNCNKKRHRQWSRSFAPLHVQDRSNSDHGEQQHVDMDVESSMSIADTLAVLIEDEVFFDSPCDVSSTSSSSTNDETTSKQTSNHTAAVGLGMGLGLGMHGVYMTERQHNGWRTSALTSGNGNDTHLIESHNSHQVQQVNHMQLSSSNGQSQAALRSSATSAANRSTRIAAQLLDGVLENSRRPQMRRMKYFSINDLDDRTDHRPFFTYWINTVQIAVLFLSIICYGIAPIGFGTEHKTGQVLVTSLSLQTVQHVEQRNLWIGPRNNDLVHIGSKFAACMRRDVRIIEVLTKTRRQERETACCIRNDDSGCVQSSQADCSIRGLYPTKSISTWKKWSPGESGPGGRISGSVCGLDPKFCDAPASIAPYEWPDDITKWPICRKTNSLSQRYRYKDHTAEHMVCEVIGHPCCTGLYGECRITTREYCDFVNGYFHEEASLCSQISCLNNVCGMFPFISVEIPDQIYRLLTSLCMHAGVLHLAITLIFQHLFLADLERLIGTLRTAVVYIMSGLVGNLTSAVLVPHRPEVGPSASLCGVVSSLIALLLWMHWKYLHKPYMALFKLLFLCTVLFGIGTLPYQLNFVGLLAGVVCGAFLTISLVPFTFTKYGRRKKINLIWTCIVFHLLVPTTLIATFYVYPTEFSTFHFVDDIFSSSGNSYINATNSNVAQHNSEVISSITQRYVQTEKPQHYYHHHSEDIIRNSVAYTEETSKLVKHIYPEAQRQKSAQFWQDGVHSRFSSYNSNYSGRSYKNMKDNTIADRILLKIKETLNSPTPGLGILSNIKNNSHVVTETDAEAEIEADNTIRPNQKYDSNINNTDFKGL